MYLFTFFIIIKMKKLSFLFLSLIFWFIGVGGVSADFDDEFDIDFKVSSIWKNIGLLSWFSNISFIDSYFYFNEWIKQIYDKFSISYYEWSPGFWNNLDGVPHNDWLQESYLIVDSILYTWIVIEKWQNSPQISWKVSLEENFLSISDSFIIRNYYDHYDVIRCGVWYNYYSVLVYWNDLSRFVFSFPDKANWQIFYDSSWNLITDVCKYTAGLWYSDYITNMVITFRRISDWWIDIYHNWQIYSTSSDIHLVWWDYKRDWNNFFYDWLTGVNLQWVDEDNQYFNEFYSKKNLFLWWQHTKSFTGWSNNYYVFNPYQYHPENDFAWYVLSWRTDMDFESDQTFSWNVFESFYTQFIYLITSNYPLIFFVLFGVALVLLLLRVLIFKRR